MACRSNSLRAASKRDFSKSASARVRWASSREAISVDSRLFTFDCSASSCWPVCSWFKSSELFFTRAINCPSATSSPSFTRSSSITPSTGASTWMSLVACTRPERLSSLLLTTGTAATTAGFAGASGRGLAYQTAAAAAANITTTPPIRSNLPFMVNTHDTFSLHTLGRIRVSICEGASPCTACC